MKLFSLCDILFQHCYFSANDDDEGIGRLAAASLSGKRKKGSGGNTGSGLGCGFLLLVVIAALLYFIIHNQI